MHYPLPGQFLLENILAPRFDYLVDRLFASLAHQV